MHHHYIILRIYCLDFLRAPFNEIQINKNKPSAHTVTPIMPSKIICVQQFLPRPIDIFAHFIVHMHIHTHIRGIYTHTQILISVCGGDVNRNSSVNIVTG